MLPVAAGILPQGKAVRGLEPDVALNSGRIVPAGCGRRKVFSDGHEHLV